MPAAPASAHTTLKSADPAAGAAVAPPAKITLTYADPVMLPQVVLLDAGGTRLSSAGAAHAVDNVVTVPITGTLPNGAYKVGWRVVATDGHPVTGTYPFTVTGSTGTAAPAAAAPSPAARADSGSGSAGWLWIGLGAAAVAAVAGGAAALRRRRAA
ncbi:copper resistance protein CopC [Actinomadura sp. PM05-2]|uniref:Copper resistance protein CopC n=1 Tax=Actinomadura parmotrematis TaxID=2864039 RepID=A0ABS7FRR0_9ACTN|nr:copper resistance protein CopC [Actinomadura parmotrematis]